MIYGKRLVIYSKTLTKIKCVPPTHSSESISLFTCTQMKNPTITVTTTESVYYLTSDEYSRAVQNGLEDLLGAEVILSVEEGRITNTLSGLRIDKSSNQL